MAKPFIVGAIRVHSGDVDVVNIYSEGLGILSGVGSNADGILRFGRAHWRNWRKPRCRSAAKM